MIQDARRALRPWVIDPISRVRFELHCLRLALLFHSENNLFRKLVLLVLVAVWTVLTLGVRTGPAVPSWTYTVLTALVFLVVGRMWGIEVRNLGLPVDVIVENEDDEK